MARSVYFSNGRRSEQLTYEDIIVESIGIYGQNFYYIPRILVGKDEILGEDRLSQFKHAYGIEMYLENVNGFEGQGAFIQKFGLMMEQSATLTVARRRWEQLIGRFGNTTIPSRPCEGDLLYFPLTGGLFEIKFVTHQDPFYQVGKLFVYKLQVELFQYSSEKIDTGFAQINVFEDLKSFSTDIIKDGTVKSIKVTDKGFGYTSAPTVLIGREWEPETAVTVRQEIAFENRTYIVTRAGTTGSVGPTFTQGVASDGTAQLQYFGTRATATATVGTGDAEGEIVQIVVNNKGTGYSTPPEVILVGGGYQFPAKAVSYIENLDNQDSFGDNNKFKEEAVGILYNESNPFGGGILPVDRKSTRLNSSHIPLSRMPSSA